MKLTRKILKEMILKELSGTAGGSADIAARKKVASDVKTKKSTKKTRKSTWDTKKTAKTKKQSAYDSAVSDYNTKQSTLDTKSAGEPDKFQWTVGRRIVTGATAPRGASNLQTRGAWTTWNSEKSAAQTARDNALTAKKSKKTEKDTADSEASTAETDYNQAIDDLTQAEKDMMAQKAATSFAVSAGGGGRKGGKAGTAKKGKKESLFRILGRDLLNEIDDIKTSLKNQKKLHKK